MTLERRGVVESDVIGVTSSDDLKRRVDILKTIFFNWDVVQSGKKIKRYWESTSLINQTSIKETKLDQKLFGRALKWFHLK